jgi:competence protein ComGC
MMEQTAPLQSKPKTSGMAIWSLILSFIPIFCLVGLILGIISAVKINKRKNELSGKGLAIGGIVIGALNTLTSCFILPIIAAIAIPNFISMQTKAKDAQVEVVVNAVQVVVEEYKVEQNREPMSIQDFEAKLPETTRQMKNPYNKSQTYTVAGGGLVNGEPTQPGQVGFVASQGPGSPYEVVGKLKNEDFRLTEEIASPPEEPQGE